MSEVVVEFPVDLGDEAQAFGAYVSRFVESVSAKAERLSAFAEAPYFMMRSDPLADRELKVLTFQQLDDAQDFSEGWALERSRLLGPSAV